MLALYGTEVGVNCARKHIGWYTKGLHGSAEFRNAFNKEADAGARAGDAARFLRALADAGRPPETNGARRCGGRPHSLCSLCHIVVLGPQCERRSRDPCRVPTRPRWRRRCRVMRRRGGWMPVVEVGVVAAALIAVAVSYFIIVAGGDAGGAADSAAGRGLAGRQSRAGDGADGAVRAAARASGARRDAARGQEPAAMSAWSRSSR